jgi:hypothetical protein
VVFGDARDKRYQTQGESMNLESLTTAVAEVLCAYDDWSSRYAPGMI